MIKKLNLILIFLMLMLLSLGAVSASQDSNDTLSITEVELTEIDESGEIQSASSYTVTPANYGQYFSGKGELSSTVKDGDTLTLSGEFSSKNFVIDKNITVVGSGATIKNGIITLKSGASGSDISGLKIINNGDKLQGFFLDAASYCNIHDNVINNTGVSSYPICLNTASNYNKITNNLLQTKGATYGHGSRSTSLIVLGGANYNYIAENTLYSEDANAIYLSTYGNGGEFKGGESNHNIIYKNNITYTILPTSWAYAIQLMGSYNVADSNIINGAYRGVSSANYPGNQAINNIINIEGKDFSSNTSTGGDYGIALAKEAVIKNNTITGLVVGAAISGADSSVIEDNYVDVSKGYGIEASGNDVIIKNNEVHTASSAAVHQQGLYEGIVVDRNTLISESGIGVLLSKASKTKYPSNITITNNRILTSNQYIIDASDADKESYTIKNNTGSGMILTPNGQIDPSVPDFVYNGTIHYITPDNYHSFIDSDGNLMSDAVYDGDILYFVGEFSDKQILVTKSVKITGENPVFLNSTFMVTSDAVWIENLTIINRHAPRLDAWAIFTADTQTIKIVNNNISVYDPAAAYAIYIYQSSKVYVENNTLFSNGESLTYTLLGYGAENCEFTGNTVNCLGTGEIHPFETTKSINGNTSEVCIGQCLGDVLKEHCLDGTNVIPEIYRTYGILMIKSSNNTVDNNNVYVTSLVNESLALNSTNSIVGIDFYYDCDNNKITNNIITVEGKDNYIYGAGALAQSTGQFSTSSAKNNLFSNNNITVKGDNVIEGLIFGQSCEDTVIVNNNIVLNTDRTVYGINLEASQKSTIENNTLTISAGIAYGIEAYESNDNVITANTIIGDGKVISGFAGINTNNNIIENNVIESNGDASSLGFIIKDVIRASNSGLFIDGISTGNIVNNNSITTLNGYPVDLSKDAYNNSVTNNFLKGKEGSGDEGVNNSQNNTVKNNYASTFDSLEMDDSTAAYMDSITITVKGEKDYDGATVTFEVNGEIIGNSTFNNGVASLDYDLSEKYVIGNYMLTASVSKPGFKSEKINSSLNVIKANITVVVDDVTAKPGTTVPFTAAVHDLNGNPLASQEVKFYRNANYIGVATTDNNGVATANIQIPSALSGSFTIFAYVSETDNYMNGVGNASLTISAKAKTPTKIEVNDVTMYYGDGTRLYVTLKDLSGNTIKAVPISFTLNGVTFQKTTNDQGSASSPLNLNVNNYTAVVRFDGNDQYEASQANATVIIKSAIVTQDVELMYMNGTRFYAAIMVNGRPVAGEVLRFNINGVLYDRTTNAVGTTSMPLKIPANKYTVTVERISTGEKVSNTVIVNSLLVDNHDITLYYRNGTGYTVTVYKQDGSLAGKGENVTFNINGVFYTRKTNESGIARLNLNLVPGNYIITAEYNDCRVSNKINVLPVLYASDLTKKYGTSDQFKVLLLGPQGKPLANTEITFNINGVFYQRTTHEDGYAVLNIRLQAGKYIITSTYNGASIANTVTITP